MAARRTAPPPNGAQRRENAPAPARALLVVDMLRGFLEPGAALYCGEAARAILPYVARRIRAYARRGEPVLFVCDRHAPDDPEFRLYPPHCVAGTPEAEIAPELPVPEGAVVLPKRTIDAFYRTGLEGRLRRLGVREVEVVGVCTNICVLMAVAGLTVRGYTAVVPRRGVATFDPAAHEPALEQMRSVFGAQVR